MLNSSDDAQGMHRVLRNKVRATQRLIGRLLFPEIDPYSSASDPVASFDIIKDIANKPRMS